MAEPAPKRKTVSEHFSDGFFKHLDECKQCCDQPFNLCSTGKILLGAFHNTLTPEELAIVAKARSA